MRHVSVISGYPISTCFRWLTGFQRDPRDKDVTVGIFESCPRGLIFKNSVSSGIITFAPPRPEYLFSLYIFASFRFSLSF